MIFTSEKGKDTLNFMSTLSRRIKHFLAGLHVHERRRLGIIGGAIIVLLLGGIILFFTNDGASPKTAEKTPVKFTCRDSDGSNARIKGAVTYTDENGKHVDEDFCAPTEKAVYEMTCRKVSFWSLAAVPEKKTISCMKQCINGACVK